MSGEPITNTPPDTEKLRLQLMASVLLDALTEAVGAIEGYRSPSSVVRAVMEGHIPSDAVPDSFRRLREAKDNGKAAIALATPSPEPAKDVENAL